MKTGMQQRLRLGAVIVLTVGLFSCRPSSEVDVSGSNSCGLSDSQIGAFIEIPSGSFVKGKEPFYPEEGSSIRLKVGGFRIQTHEVTNAQFSTFVAETNYITDAEQGVIAGRAGAGSALFVQPENRGAGMPHWVLSPVANWRMPDGAGSSIEGKKTHPVVHISKRDAAAYAQWAGGRLPSEVEWEYAASLGLPDPNDQSSGAYGVNGPRANTWQGIFPVANLTSDGFDGVAPVGCFEPDRHGLYDMIGNVWEWTATPFGEGTHTLKGGSYLCADNFCRRYRPAARHPQETDFSSSHIGFRIVRDVELGVAN